MARKVAILSSAKGLKSARLHRLANTLIRGGYEIHIWAPGDNRDAPIGSEVHKILGSKSKFARIARDLSLPFLAKGDIFFTLSPDLIPLTYLVAKFKKKKLVADLNEDYLKLLKDRSWAKGILGILAKMIAKISNYVAGRADLLIVADSQVPPFHVKNRLVVKNYPDSKMIPLSGELGTTPRAIYIGDIRKTRGLYAMLRIAELSPKWKFDFVGSLSEEDKKSVVEWQMNSSASSRVKFHGELEPHKSWNFAVGAWVGLTLLEPTPAFVEAVPSKLYEYAFAGLATLSSPLPRCVELIKESGGGAIVADEFSAAKLLNSWADNPMPLIEIRKKAKDWAHQVLNVDGHYAIFLAAVNKI